MPKRVTLFVLASIFIVSCALDAYSTLCTDREIQSDANIYLTEVKYYDPHVGRFITRDPLGDGLNWYVYARNNPLAFIDPTGLRAVNNREREALHHAFGRRTANWLIRTIDVQFDEDVPGGRASKGKKITLNPSYSSENLYDLSLFIHEAAHIWQWHTGLHRHGDPGDDYKYTVAQLFTMDLKIEEHAQAVADWFFISFGVAAGWILDKPTDQLDREKKEVNYEVAWTRVLGRMGVAYGAVNFQQPFWNNTTILGTIASNLYRNVWKEIQNPNLVPALQPKVPRFP